MIELPSGVQAMAHRGPEWRQWVDGLAARVQTQVREWGLQLDGAPMHGATSVVLPVLSAQGRPAVLKLSFPDAESDHEHLALRRWGGQGAVRLLSADPHRRAVLLERLTGRDLTALPDDDACRVIAALYRRIHVPALPQVRSLRALLERWTAELASLPRDAAVPHRLVEQAVAHSRDLLGDGATTGTLIHTDLHYANVLGADREPWLVIDPKPLDGDPHYEVAPLLWNRWDELAGDVRSGVQRRFWTTVDAAEFDEDRARAWVVIRMMLNAMWELTETARPDADWLTVCVAVAKAVQN
ncbi:aminoglycoside resistance protein [Mycobacterium sp. 852013-51886_SCH5428379]|uniref:aminoglycoside phosphotransferase family protein n=1 Tax=Mycobacterium sp. 852013-51886_SCH5428379 TaxID=1834111 RepID=UPI000800DB29|nr:aminoglycoside phosphotransferase family protein [Mycobacterium sp. 852013-51886_SCH5428379]OBB61994.1 aminoglycoside resistance protein [Mycobacterium sp. 852013-51886_SCH5428379]